MKRLPLIAIVREFKSHFKEKWDNASKDDKIQSITWFRKAENYPLEEDETDVPKF